MVSAVHRNGPLRGITDSRLNPNLRFWWAFAHRVLASRARESGRRSYKWKGPAAYGRGPGFPEAPPGFEPGIEDLQSSALPLGHGAEIETSEGPKT